MDSHAIYTGTYPKDDQGDLFRVTRDEFLTNRDAKTYGTANPSIMDNPFWKHMIAKGGSSFTVRETFDNKKNLHEDDRVPRGDRSEVTVQSPSPVWCFDRFGATLTELPDGRHVYIGGEHEDYYDPDFCIYNDVVVIAKQPKFNIYKSSDKNTDEGDDLGRDSHESSIESKKDGNKNAESESDEETTVFHVPRPRVASPEDITIYGYPIDVFPPTDFHTSTYFCDAETDKEFIIIIGGLDYKDSTLRNQTDVHRLDLSNFRIEKLRTSGVKPLGGTDRHQARLILGGKEAEPMINIRTKEGKEFSLLLRSLEWVSSDSGPESIHS
ncbi:hypothetical protein BGZ46_006822 [Entomortierella lignicola]|nr:hypothetical protein BGZ46_006822 [Entomortierella lignicola]